MKKRTNVEQRKEEAPEYFQVLDPDAAVELETCLKGGEGQPTPMIVLPAIQRAIEKVKKDCFSRNRPLLLKELKRNDVSRNESRVIIDGWKMGAVSYAVTRVIQRVFPDPNRVVVCWIIRIESPGVAKPIKITLEPEWSMNVVLKALERCSDRNGHLLRDRGMLIALSEPFKGLLHKGGRPKNPENRWVEVIVGDGVTETQRDGTPSEFRRSMRAFLRKHQVPVVPFLESKMDAALREVLVHLLNLEAEIDETCPRWPLQNAPLVAGSKCSTPGDSLMIIY